MLTNCVRIIICGRMVNLQPTEAEMLVHKLDLHSNIELGPQSNWLGFRHQFFTVAYIDVIGE